MDRREYLAAVGAAAGVAVAGCSGDGGGTDTGTTTSETTTETETATRTHATTETTNDTTEAASDMTTAAGGEETSVPAADDTVAGTPSEAGTSSPSDTAEMATSESPRTESATETEARTATTAEATPTRMEQSTTTGSMTAGSGGSGTGSASIGSSEFTKVTDAGVSTAAMTGEVTASGGRLQSLELQARFRNDAGDLLSTESAYFQGLDDGQTWLFYVPYLGDAAAATDGEVEVAEAVAGPAPPTPTAEVIESNLQQPSDQFTGPTVTARVENTGDGTLAYLEARVKFLTGDGAALSSNYTNVTELPAGEVWSFSLEQLTFSADDRPAAEDYEITLAE